MRILQAALYWVMIGAVIVAMGIVYDVLFLEGGELMASSIFALFCGMPILIFRRGFPSRRFHAWLRSRPTPLYYAISLAVAFLLVNLGYSVGAMVVHWLGLLEGEWWMLHLLPADIFFYSLGGSGLVLFLLHVRELLGRRVFISLLTGRYRNPVEEERVFLFIDLVDSVSFAEARGDAETLRLLGALYAMMDPHVRRHGGAVDDYIGDAAMITWPLQKGLKRAACINCVFDILADIARHEARWQRVHGRVPRLRAALHAGPVVTGEVGLDHRKITYFGNTVNIAARLEGLAKELDQQVVISADLRERMVLPKDIRAIDLGTHAVKGRAQPIRLFGLHSLAPGRRS
ncbi:adenylate/guanylate cyclase domain-containing protein [Gellertiella hungarica]|uniref:Adenylate cyclase n=1 Tax=Gellertiella hungarica TaxID=1572859 RepID=A0A7W6J775_9HYPH|nr:adenylate/guanylate cyclase domain-containing protein [Gellertiella hungarica]MBB4066049.1 adenylate cyclase [Gellertiella hungarica]